MKKPLIAFAAVFALVFGFFVFIEMEKIDTEAAIAKAPAFVTASPEGVTKRTKKGRESFQINYTYEVAGNKYTKNSEWFDTEAEAMKSAEKPVEIAYAKDAPATSEFKSEFDQRDPNAGLVSAMKDAAGFGLLAALFLTLVLVWKFPWLRTA